MARPHCRANVPSPGGRVEVLPPSRLESAPVRWRWPMTLATGQELEVPASDEDVLVVQRISRSSERVKPAADRGAAARWSRAASGSVAPRRLPRHRHAIALGRSVARGNTSTRPPGDDGSPANGGRAHQYRIEVRTGVITASTVASPRSRVTRATLAATRTRRVRSAPRARRTLRLQKGSGGILPAPSD